jgi:hypothetical protein
MDADLRRDGPTNPAGLLRCGVCKKVVECERAELTVYVRDGWPECCREVMSFYLPGDPFDFDRPDHADTEPPTGL